ncbi:MAG: TetR/AcrR family transcriptional regulator [Lachnospiraceae bacterium]|nr:TetR/AcrR family transcriptional regulator [Lachnospiraceae bacterium]
MKHEVTTLNTKHIIAESLKKAMMKKPFSKITVSEIISDCGVNRKTFYYHFEDTHALMKWMLKTEVIEVVKSFDLLLNYEEAIFFVFDYMDKNGYIINCVCDDIGQEGMKQLFRDDLFNIINSIIDRVAVGAGKKLEPDYQEFLVWFYSEAIAGTLLDYTKNKEIPNRKKTAAYLSAMMGAAVSHIENIV